MDKGVLREKVEVYYGAKKKRERVLQDRVRNTKSLHQLYKTAMSCTADEVTSVTKRPVLLVRVSNNVYYSTISTCQWSRNQGGWGTGQPNDPTGVAWPPHFVLYTLIMCVVLYNVVVVHPSQYTLDPPYKIGSYFTALLPLFYLCSYPRILDSVANYEP